MDSLIKRLQEATYTIAQIDAAIIDIVPSQRAIISRSRPHAMLDAAGVAWVNERPEDDHSRILRAAIKDLNTFGHLKPHDGVWPEEPTP